MDVNLILETLEEAGYIARFHNSINSVSTGVPDKNQESKITSILELK